MLQEETTLKAMKVYHDNKFEMHYFVKGELVLLYDIWKKNKDKKLTMAD